MTDSASTQRERVVAAGALQGIICRERERDFSRRGRDEQRERRRRRRERETK
jgi:hypothetical protein